MHDPNIYFNSPRPCTKWNCIVTDIKDLPRAINTAFHVAKSGRPGPVLVDLPKNVTQTVLEEAVDTTPYQITDPNVVGGKNSSMCDVW